MRTRARLLLCLLLPAAPVRSGEGEVRLLTDDAIPRYLARGQVLARNGEWEKVVDVLHRVVIGDKEVFPDLRPEILHSAVYSEDGQLFYPARELCLKELSRLPPEGLRAYRSAHDREARELFAQAEAAASLEERLTRYAGVYDTFLPSSVADDALEKAGDINLALGRYYEALALFRRLIDVYPKDTDRQLGMVFVKAAYCAARIGDKEHRNVLLERLASEHADARLRIEGKPVRAAELREHPLLETRGAAAHAAEADWPLPGGDATRARIAPDLPEDLPRKPFWAFNLAERDPRLHASYGKWLVRMHNREAVPEPSFEASGHDNVWPYPTPRPVVHDGVVFYKDYVETVARRIGSGTLVPLGRYDTPDADTLDDPRYRYPASLVRPGSQGKEANTTEYIYRHLDYGGNTIVIGDDRLVVVEQRRFPAALQTVEPVPQRPNLLVAYDRGSGKTMWGWRSDLCARAVRRDAAQLEAWQRDFQNHPTPVFMGPGVIAGGILYTVAHEKEELAGVSLWAINVRDGRVRFRTPLHYADEVRKQVPRGASVAVAGGVVYAVTHGGIVAAVDALPPGRVRWIRRYRRNHVGRRGRTRARIHQAFAYNDPVVSGGKVVVMAADAEEVVALDAETGRMAWTHSKQSLGSLAHVVGVADGVLVLAGNQVVGLDLARGTTVWGPRALEGWPRGRGVIGAKYVYVPTRHASASRSYLERFGVTDGVPAAPLPFDVARLGNLVISDGRLVVVNGEEVMCFTTQDAELERIDARIAEEGPTSDLLLERAQIALAGDSPRHDRARADFLKALDAAAAEGTDDLSIRARAIENLLAIADMGSDLAALDEAQALVAPMAAHRLEGDDRRHHPYEAQVALARVELLGRVGRGEEALRALERFLDLHGRSRVRRDGRALDGAVAAGRLRDHLLASSTAFKVAFSRSVRGRIQAAFQSGDKETLRTIPERYEFKPPSEEAYFAHARLCEDNGELDEAEQVLRGFITRFRGHRRRASAHLHLARILVRQAKPLHARRERYEGISRLDELGRAENAKLLEELDELLRSGQKPRPQPRIRIPLATRPTKIRSATPVPVQGDLSGLPAGYTLFSGANGYFALDGAGEVLWTQPDPAGGGAAAGPVDEPDTLVIAAEIAAARLAVRDGDDLILGDVAGVMRLNARTGEVAWRYPARAAEAQAQRDQSIALLRSDLRTLRTSGHILRRHPLPAHTLAGGIVVRVHVMTGLDGLDARTGRTVLFDPDIRGAPVGPPAVMGELLAVGWSKPGRVRVYHLQTGKPINDLKPAVLFAPPVIDPLGRVVIIGAEREGQPGQLSLVNARLEEPAHPVTYRVPSTNAATLYADGRLVIYHDGSSGTKNLHFLDLDKHTRESYAAADFMRHFRVLRDGSRLFVFTSNPGLEDEGARLFRIDIPSREVLSYELALKAHAYSRPVVTQRYIAVAASLARSAHVRLFDRDASPAGRDPYPVFAAADGKETAALDFQPREGTDYALPPSLALSGDGFVVGHPFGVARLLARDTR